MPSLWLRASATGPTALQDMQQRLGEERRAMEEEAAARVHAATAASESTAQAFATSHAVSLESQYSSQLAAIDEQRAALAGELVSMQAQFR